MPEKSSVVVGGKPVSSRHQERGAEHRDDVLGPDRDRRRPGQALVGADDRLARPFGRRRAASNPGSWVFTVASPGRRRDNTRAPEDPIVNLPRRGLALASSTVIVGSLLLPQASAAPPTLPVTLTPIGTFPTGAFDEGGSEIVAYDARGYRAFSVNAQAGTVDVLDISEPTKPAKVGQPATPGANSVAVQGRTIAVAEQAEDKTDRGTVALFDAATLKLVKRVRAGALPDMVTITDDGNCALVANEGEPEGYCDGQIDPAGSVSVIDLSQRRRRAPPAPPRSRSTTA